MVTSDVYPRMCCCETSIFYAFLARMGMKLPTIIEGLQAKISLILNVLVKKHELTCCVCLVGS